jgi:fatty-acyl-CoA synthase
MESCVCGIDDDKFGEIVGAYIYTNKELTKEDLKMFMADKLANYKVPEVIIFTTESLPRIASEKIDRVTIKQLLS